MKTKIRNFRIPLELDTKLIQSAERLGSDPSAYLRSLVEFGCSLVMHDPLRATKHSPERRHDEN
jgi:predicted DNA-binding protein